MTFVASLPITHCLFMPRCSSAHPVWLTSEPTANQVRHPIEIKLTMGDCEDKALESSLRWIARDCFSHIGQRNSELFGNP